MVLPLPPNYHEHANFQVVVVGDIFGDCQLVTKNAQNGTLKNFPIIRTAFLKTFFASQFSFLHERGLPNPTRHTASTDYIYMYISTHSQVHFPSAVLAFLYDGKFT